MCSVQDEGDVLRPDIRDKSSVPRKCMKCQMTANVIIRVNDAMCSNCFTSYATHKFRSAFGKSKLVRDQEKVLVAYSGGPSSSAMVHLIQQGLSKRAQKKLRFIPSLVYIDEGAVIDQKAEERLLLTQNVVSLMTCTQLPYSVYTLEQVNGVREGDDTPTAAAAAASGSLTPILDSSNSEKMDLANRLNHIMTADDRLSKLLVNAKTLTAKQYLVSLLRLRLLAAVAKQQGVTKVLLGNCATRLSVHLLSSISQGQGAHLPYDISFADNRFKDVTLIRPMREFTAKEVAMYNSLNHVDSIFIPNLSTKADRYSSIEQLTESFVSGLQAEYPNTVSTIFRTGEKFDLSECEPQTEQSCCMCHCPLDTDVGASSALNATRFSLSLCSKMASSKEVDVPMATKTSCPSLECKQDSYRLERPGLDRCLCYGCQIIVQDLSCTDHLPCDVTEELSRQRQSRQIREQLSDYLLGDAEDG